MRSFNYMIQSESYYQEIREKLDKIYPYYGATSILDYVDKYLVDGIYLLLGENGSVIDSEGFPILLYTFVKFRLNNHAHIITGKNGFSVETLYLIFSLTRVNDIVTGAVQLKISQQNLKKVEAIIPLKQTLREFDDIIQPILDKLESFKWIIKSLFFFEIRYFQN